LAGFVNNAHNRPLKSAKGINAKEAIQLVNLKKSLDNKNIKMNEVLFLTSSKSILI
jgi:hypothetical protein